MREFIVSLGVKDREAAKRLIPEYAADTQRQLDEAEVKLAAEGPAESREAIQAAERVRIAAAAAEASAEGFAARAKWRDHRRTRMALSTAKLSPEEAALKDLYDAGELGQETRDHERLDAVREPVRAEHEARIAQGQATRHPRRAPVIAVRGLFDGYADRSDIRPETIKQFRAIIEHLMVFAKS